MSLEVIRAKRTPSGKFWVVLCHLPDNQVTPYCTWIADGPGTTSDKFSGHYHRNLEEAKSDWDSRIF